MKLEENDNWIAFYDSQKGGWIQRSVRHLTKWAWKHQMRSAITRMYERGLISSTVLHEGIDYANRVISMKKPSTKTTK